ncbi:hypothetical protein HPB52_014645 [Rhipicephalus sanguineus]|uniref:Peptidase aspartic putative domain-containing protein n=1 Tax=Rhipicephalus sanguineus TaxID=34632 RepID=A0A9D4T0E4_RHISA|nr:hypothetical protein HPB52_014645 [Rhipicephalus sanguineus]
MAMANSDQLRKKRSALRTGVTRALTQLTDLLQQTDPNISEVSVQLDYLKDRESTLSRLDDAILAVTEEDDLDREVETTQDYSDKISYALARAKYWLQERHQATRTHAQASGFGSSNLELPNSVDAPGQTPEDRIRRAKDLLTFLRIQVEVREEGRLQLRRRPHESEKMSMATESTGGAEHIPSAAALTSSAVSVNQVCPLCNSSGHSIVSCNATLSADDKLCKKSYSLTCGTCRRHHLTILCELSRPVEGLPPTAESVALGRPPLPSLRTVTTAQSTHIGSTVVLLQTGRIWAECGNRRLLARVLLDSGSQRSYIREDAARKHQCSVVGREELSLITFGNSKSQRRLRAERVSVRLRSQFDDAAVELEALTIPEICSVTSPPLENNILQALIAKEYKAFPSETRIIQFTKPSPAAGRWKRVRQQASMSTLILAARVVVIGGRMGVTPHLRNFSQIGYFLCEHHDEDRIFEILHAEYIVIKHLKDALNAIRVGPKDGKGCDSRKSMTAVNRHFRNQSELLAGIRPAQERFERTAQKERKGRNSSFNGDVNEMEYKAQLNGLGYVPLFELLPISGEDTSLLSLEESHEGSKLLVSTLGLEGTCMEPLQQSLPRTTLTEPGSCQVLPNMNCEIGMDTNVVHVYENNENAVAERAMNFSYVSLPQLINDLNNIGLMITDRPLKSSRCHWLSWKSIRLRRRLESKLDELQQLISSQFLLGSRHISVPQRASASGLANALPLQRKARHRQRLSTELRKRRQRAYLFLLRPRYHRSSCTMDAYYTEAR